MSKAANMMGVSLAETWRRARRSRSTPRMVRTGMTGGNRYIDVDEAVAGLLARSMKRSQAKSLGSGMPTARRPW